ncbi:MAG: histidine phosphatase family protein [Prevotellaceae bacterium]|jgi:probable phosphoglycerate mutase|nr:histidine phosphatase family protein [Prevotellaceae bacterium]
MNRIIIARHGNTFRTGEIPRRIGTKTDIPLVEYHKAESIGKYLKHNNLVPSAVYAAPLRRTVETAEIAVQIMDIELEVRRLSDFSEIDYGHDENRTDEEIFIRLGKGNRDRGIAIIDAWNKNAIVPNGWQANSKKIMQTWIDFANRMLDCHSGQNTLIVSSNGIIRFAPCLTGNFEKFLQEHDIKVSTGGICIFEYIENEKKWRCCGWNIKPYEIYA